MLWLIVGAVSVGIVLLALMTGGGGGGGFEGEPDGHYDVRYREPGGDWQHVRYHPNPYHPDFGQNNRQVYGLYRESHPDAEIWVNGPNE